MPFISDHASMIPRWSARLVSPQRRWLVVICAVVLAALLLGTSNAQRRSGGGFGGRSNSSPSSRYVPSAPLTSGGYIPVPVPVPSYGFGYGGGYGFGGGFGLGGIFIVAVLLGGGFLLFRRFLPVAGQSNQPSGLFTGGNSSGASAVSIQLVLTEGDEVKRALSDKRFTVDLADRSSWKLEYKANGYFFVNTSAGFNGSGTWKIQDDKVCTDGKGMNASCGVVYQRGDSLFMRRSATGEIIELRPR